ncbi:MAG: preprotein translocase subunit SecE [Patescibacteria group bacterium]
MRLAETIISYLRGTKEEIRKVSWPSRQDTFRYSALVVGASIVVAVFFATLDFGFTELVNVTVTQRAARRIQNAEQAAPPTNVKPELEKSAAPTSSRPAADVQTITPTFDVKDLETAAGAGSIKIVK